MTTPDRQTPFTVYLVDDDVDFITAARRLILKFQPEADVRAFDSPGKAIAALFVEDEPDLIITDLVFPGPTTGLDVLRSARVRHIPCVVCSEVPDLMEGTLVQPKERVLGAMSSTLSGPQLALG